jgi:ATP-dependent helicase HrpB
LAREARPQLDRFLPPPDSAAGSFLARVRWLAESLPELELPKFDAEELAAMLPEVCIGLRSLDDIRTADWLSRLQQEVGYERIAEIERLAPREFELTNGNRHPLTYEPGRPPLLAVKIQELFGVRETPRIGGGRVAVLLHLLGPNKRPQQVTSDLASFWANTYPEVKKELRRRYPKHAWPDDPLAVQATRSGLKRDMK